MSLHRDWNVFGCMVETAGHGGRTGGRVAFNGHNQPFADGLPVSPREMAPYLNAMGIGDGDDELLEDVGVSSEFYGTRMGDGSVRGALSPLSERETVGWADVEDSVLGVIDGSAAESLRRFMRSRRSSWLGEDDRTYVWSVIDECGECETAEQVKQLESLLETIERRLALRAKAAQAETPEVKVRTAVAKPELKRSATPEVKDGERKGRRRGHRGGRNRNRGQAPQAQPTARPATTATPPASTKPESPKDKGGRVHDIKFVEGKHPKTGEREWSARTGRGILFVLARGCKLIPEPDKEYRCREIKLVAKTRRGKIIAVEPA